MVPVNLGANGRLPQSFLHCWNENSDYGDDGVYLFEPHSRPVCCMYFSASHPAHLLTLSYDGTIRCADVNKAVFDDVYQREGRLSCFDFLSKDGSTLIAGGCNGNVMVVDRRAQRCELPMNS
ncbi:UNVERIFIED_CONTAM: hypothetical protein FKN15_046187 [Acipenser sinensis]